MTKVRQLGERQGWDDLEGAAGAAQDVVAPADVRPECAVHLAHLEHVRVVCGRPAGVGQADVDCVSIANKSVTV